MKDLNLLLIFIILLSFGSCRSDSETPTEVKVDNTIKTGKLSGKVMSQNGTKPIGGASIFTFDDKYKIYYTTSDSDGNFTLEAPVGNHTIHIQTGNGSNFRTEIAATVKNNETVNLNVNQTKLNQVAKIAYLEDLLIKLKILFRL